MAASGIMPGTNLLGRFTSPFKRAASMLLLLCVSLALLGCAGTSSEYFGINLGADPEIDQPAVSGIRAKELAERKHIINLARLAKGGDKAALLELGIRFEDGGGLTPNIGYAIELYMMAGSDTPIKQTNFIPNGSGAVEAQTLHVGVRKGLSEAVRRLRAIDSLGSLDSESFEEDVIRRFNNKLFENIDFSFLNKEIFILKIEKFSPHQNIADAEPCVYFEKAINRSFGGVMEKCVSIRFKLAVLPSSESISAHAISYEHSKVKEYCDSFFDGAGQVYSCTQAPLMMYGISDFSPSKIAIIGQRIPKYNIENANFLGEEKCGPAVILTFRKQDGTNIKIVRGMREYDLESLGRKERVRLRRLQQESC